jgi:hypothetical protein
MFHTAKFLNLMQLASHLKEKVTCVEGKAIEGRKPEHNPLLSFSFNLERREKWWRRWQGDMRVATPVGCFCKAISSA